MNVQKKLFALLFFLGFGLSNVNTSKAGASPFIGISALTSGGGMIKTGGTPGSLTFTPSALVSVGADFTSFGFLYYGFEFNGGVNFVLDTNIANISATTYGFNPTGQVNALVRLGASFGMFKVYALVGTGAMLNVPAISTASAILEFSKVQMNFGLGTKVGVLPFINLIAEFYVSPNLFFGGVDISKIEQVFASTNALNGRIGLEITF